MTHTKIIFAFLSFRLLRIILRVKTGWLMLVLLSSNIEPVLAGTQLLNGVRQAKTDKYSKTPTGLPSLVHCTAYILRSSLGGSVHRVGCWKPLLSRYNLVEVKLALLIPDGFS